MRLDGSCAAARLLQRVASAGTPCCRQPKHAALLASCFSGPLNHLHDVSSAWHAHRLARRRPLRSSGGGSSGAAVGQGSVSHALSRPLSRAPSAGV